MEELDLVRQSARLSRAAAEWVRWRRALRQGVDFDPFALHGLVSRASFEEVLARPDYDPLRAPTLRWLFRLVDDKACRPLLAEHARLRAVEPHAVDHPERGAWTLSELLSRALRDRPRAALWLERWLERAGGAAGLERRVWERRREVAERLGTDRDAMELPHAELYPVAERFLDVTADRAAEFRRDSLAEALEQSLGLEAHQGPPARLGSDSLAALFRDTRLFDSLRLDPGPFPQPLAPASFLRALARVGAAFAVALAPSDQPFVIAHDAYGLRRLSHGALFAALPLSPPFQKRALGLGSARAAEERRALARVVLLETRARALRLLVRRAALAGERAHREAFEELTGRVLGRPLAPELAGALFRARRDEGQRFAAPLLAASHARLLVDAHDEDWYRNPRAVEQLRAEAALPPLTTTTLEALDAGARELVSVSFSLLG